MKMMKKILIGFICVMAVMCVPVNAKAAAKPTVTFKVTKNFIYDSNPHRLLSDVSVKGGTIWYKVNSGAWSKTVPSATNAGKYTVKYKVNPAKNYSEIKETTAGTVTVAKAASSVEKFTPASNLKYNKNPQKLITKSSANGGDIWYQINNGTWFDINKKIPSATNAGKYIINYYVKGDANHNDTKTTSSVTVTIARADPAVQVSFRADRIYDGGYHSLITYAETTGGTIWYRLKKDGEWIEESWVKELQKVKDAGQYEIHYYVEGDENYYSSTEEIYTAEIRRADLNNNNNLMYLSQKVYIYDGKSKEPSVEVWVELGDEEKYLKLNSDEYKVEYKKNVEVGIATVTVYGISNYTGEKNISFEIQPKTITPKVYTGTTLNIDKYIGKSKGQFQIDLKKYGAFIKSVSKDGKVLKLQDSSYYSKNKNIKIPAQGIPVIIKAGDKSYERYIKIAIKAPKLTINVKAKNINMAAKGKKENNKKGYLFTRKKSSIKVSGFVELGVKKYTISPDKKEDEEVLLSGFESFFKKNKWKPVVFSIRASYGKNISEPQTIVMDLRPTSMKLSKKSLTMKLKKPKSKLFVTVRSSCCKKLWENVSWRSSNPKVVSVDKNGNLKAKKKGKAVITVTTKVKAKNGKYLKKTCKVTVKK